MISEYSLRKNTIHRTVSEFVLTRSLPDELKASLPAVEEIEKELNADKHDALLPVDR